MELLRISDLVKKLRVSKSTIYSMIKSGEFPKQSKINRNITCWNSSDVNKWILENTGKITN